jgi:bla regulator protein BlaR1
VATIKPSDPDQQYSGTTLRRYIANAYGVPIPWGAPATEFAGSQVVGGPAWINKDRYDIKGKAPDQLRQAMEKMSEDEGSATIKTMQQSLLAERFHLKVHFETREMQLFEMVPAKGGLKIKPAAPVDDSAVAAGGPKDKMSPGSMNMMIRTDGSATLEARATKMDLFLNALRGESPEVAGRPIVDRTGFEGLFDLKDFRFAGVPLPNASGAGASGSDPDVPTLSQALEQQLGLKLIPAKGQVEVVVIDSIDRPTEN